VFTTIVNYLLDSRDRQRIAIALIKGNAMRQARQIELTNPITWEFSGFSQNGEDGIIEVLRKQLRSSNRYFVEIGASNGVENNSAWLVVAERYKGLMIEGDARLVKRANRNIAIYSIGAQCKAMFVTVETTSEILKLIRHRDPDVFSLDIDGNDYHVAQALMNGGLRPKIIVVEYNSAYGPDRELSIAYRPDFSVRQAHSSRLYYGVSIAGWRKFFETKGYRFVTVDQNGVNAFFVDPVWFDSSFIDNIQGAEFVENQAQLCAHGVSNEEQFAIIKDQKFSQI